MPAEDQEIYRVWYWDPCNGINGQSKDMGLFTKDAAERFINERVGAPGSARRLDPNNWERDAYRMKKVEVQS